MSTALISSDAIALGRRLRRARDQAGVSIALAARRLGLSRWDIDLLERGRDSVAVETLVTLAQLYDCPLQWLLTGAADAPSEGRDAVRKNLV